MDVLKISQDKKNLRKIVTSVITNYPWLSEQDMTTEEKLRTAVRGLKMNWLVMSSVFENFNLPLDMPILESERPIEHKLIVENVTNVYSSLIAVLMILKTVSYDSDDRLVGDVTEEVIDGIVNEQHVASSEVIEANIKEAVLNLGLSRTEVTKQGLASITYSCSIQAFAIEVELSQLFVLLGYLKPIMDEPLVAVGEFLRS